MLKTPDVTIIGSGIIGLLIAKELSHAGLSVMVLEKNPSAQESTWAGGGILLPLYPWRQAAAISELVIPSIKMYPALAQELFEATGIDPEWTQSGLLMTQNPDVALAQQWGEKYQVAIKAADETLFEGLNTQPLNPLWMPDIVQARNPRLLKSLKAFVLQQGVKIVENCSVGQIMQQNQRIHRIHTNLGNFDINHLVVAAGAWTAELTKSLFAKHFFFKADFAPKVYPVKGQMLLFQAEPDTLKHIILERDHYLIPRRDGKILVGSSVERSHFDKSTTPATKDALRQFAFQLLPALEKFFLLAHWAGLRPATEHGIPYIDNHPEIANLSLNAGHFRNGLTMAPASATLLADIILKRTPRVNPTPYQLIR